MQQFGGKDSKRHFTVVMGGKEHGLYVSSTPSSAAKKAVTKLCAANKSKKVEFEIREITQGSKKKTYGPYEGHIEKLKEPIELKGRVVKYKPAAKLQKKNSKMKGGLFGRVTESNSTKEGIQKMFENFKVENASEPYHLKKRSFAPNTLYFGEDLLSINQEEYYPYSLSTEKSNMIFRIFISKEEYDKIWIYLSDSLKFFKISDSIYSNYVILGISSFEYLFDMNVLSEKMSKIDKFKFSENSNILQPIHDISQPINNSFSDFKVFIEKIIKNLNKEYIKIYFNIDISILDQKLNNLIELKKKFNENLQKKQHYIKQLVKNHKDRTDFYGFINSVDDELKKKFDECRSFITKKSRSFVCQSTEYAKIDTFESLFRNWVKLKDSNQPLSNKEIREKLIVLLEKYIEKEKENIQEHKNRRARYGREEYQAYVNRYGEEEAARSGLFGI
jgi:hypothetical protein